MADGILCKHCGYQETEHEDYCGDGKPPPEDSNPVIPFEEASRLRKGYLKSLAKCKRYSPEDPARARRLAAMYEQEKSFSQRRKSWVDDINRDD